MKQFTMFGIRFKGLQFAFLFTGMLIISMIILIICAPKPSFGAAAGWASIKVIMVLLGIGLIALGLFQIYYFSLLLIIPAAVFFLGLFLSPVLLIVKMILLIFKIKFKPFSIMGEIVDWSHDRVPGSEGMSTEGPMSVIGEAMTLIVMILTLFLNGFWGLVVRLWHI